MIRTLAFFLILAGGVVSAAWLSEHPGTVLVRFGEYRLHTSVGFLVVAIFLVVLGAIFFDRLWRVLVATPKRIAVVFQESRRRRGYQALTQGLVAVAAGDAEDARRLARRAEGLLHNPPLTMLLSAQAAQLRGDKNAAADYFKSMLDHPEMAFLGIRGLFMQALQDGDEKNALEFARRAHALQPKTPWVVEALFERELRAGKLEAADATLRDAMRQRVVPSKEGNRRRAVLLLRQGMLANEQGRNADAQNFVRDAWKAAPDFGPVAIAYARLVAGEGDGRRAEKAIEKAWARGPHPDLAAAYLEIAAPGDALARLQKIEKLAHGHPVHAQSQLAVGEAALQAGLWAEARNHLAAAITALPSARAFRAMAELEARETKNDQAGAQWRARAAKAPADPRWVCGACQGIAESWSPVCANCGGFDSFAWRVPGLGNLAKNPALHPPVSM